MNPYRSSLVDNVQPHPSGRRRNPEVELLSVAEKFAASRPVSHIIVRREPSDRRVVIHPDALAQLSLGFMIDGGDDRSPGDELDEFAEAANRATPTQWPQVNDVGFNEESIVKAACGADSSAPQSQVGMSAPRNTPSTTAADVFRGGMGPPPPATKQPKLHAPPPEKPPKQRVEEAVKTCPHGHQLRAAKAPKTGSSCDVCKTAIQEGALLHCCRPCDYDECDACFAKRQVVQSARKTCPHGHQLRAAQAPQNGSHCDVCKTPVEQGATIRGCRLCDYDECAACFAKARESGGIAEALVGMMQQACSAPLREQMALTEADVTQASTVTQENEQEAVLALVEEAEEEPPEETNAVEEPIVEQPRANDANSRLRLRREQHGFVHQLWKAGVYLPEEWCGTTMKRHANINTNCRCNICDSNISLRATQLSCEDCQYFVCSECELWHMVLVASAVAGCLSAQAALPIVCPRILDAKQSSETAAP